MTTTYCEGKIEKDDFKAKNSLPDEDEYVEKKKKSRARVSNLKYECDQCEQKFNFKSSLDKHVLKFHQLETFSEDEEEEFEDEPLIRKPSHKKPKKGKSGFVPSLSYPNNFDYKSPQLKMLHRIFGA